MLDLIEQLQDLDVPTAAIRATLKKKGYSKEDIAESLPIEKKSSFANDYYSWLSVEARTSDEVKEYIMNPALGGKKDDKGLTNIQRHLSHYSAIADLARSIHEA